MNTDDRPLRTIADHWEHFLLVDMAPTAPQVQRDEMQRAFYAGCASILLLVVEATMADDADARLAALADELSEFAAAGRAREALRKAAQT